MTITSTDLPQQVTLDQEAFPKVLSLLRRTKGTTAGNLWFENGAVGFLGL